MAVYSAFSSDIYKVDISQNNFKIVCKSIWFRSVIHRDKKMCNIFYVGELTAEVYLIEELSDYL